MNGNGYPAANGAHRAARPGTSGAHRADRNGYGGAGPNGYRLPGAGAEQPRGTGSTGYGASGAGQEPRGTGPNGYGPPGAGDRTFEPRGGGPNGHGTNGVGESGYEPRATGRNGYGSNGAGDSKFESRGSGPNGYGTNGAGPNGYEPNGARYDGLHRAAGPRPDGRLDGPRRDVRAPEPRVDGRSDGARRDVGAPDPRADARSDSPRRDAPPAGPRSDETSGGRRHAPRHDDRPGDRPDASDGPGRAAAPGVPGPDAPARNGVRPPGRDGTGHRYPAPDRAAAVPPQGPGRHSGPPAAAPPLRGPAPARSGGVNGPPQSPAGATAAPRRPLPGDVPPPRRPGPSPAARPPAPDDDPPTVANRRIPAEELVDADDTAIPGRHRRRAGEPPEERPAAASRADAAPTGSDTRGARRRPAFWKELPILIVVALLLTFLIQTFVAKVYVIPSGSMETTLHGCTGCNNDRVLVDKVTYRFSDPRPGDVVVFRGPEGWTSEFTADPPANAIAGALQQLGSLIGLAPPDEKDFIKRVIAVGGQTVQCCDTRNRVLVDGKPLDESYIYYLPDAGPARQEPFDPVTVPQGQLWMMGDSRNNSADSRVAGHGAVPVEDVIGKARLIVLPFGRFGTIPDPDPQTAVGMAGSAADAGAPLALGLVGILPLWVLRRRERRLDSFLPELRRSPPAR